MHKRALGLGKLNQRRSSVQVSGTSRAVEMMSLIERRITLQWEDLVRPHSTKGLWVMARNLDFLSA